MLYGRKTPKCRPSLWSLAQVCVFWDRERSSRYQISMENNTAGGNTDPLARIPQKPDLEVRFATFNVNGGKALFNYHPWNQLRGSVNAFLRALEGDIVALQELKIQLDAIPRFGLLDDYRAFILVPKSKKGYSGVGLFVRVPRPDDPPHTKQALTVIKAEEGITGRLEDGSKAMRYCDLPVSESIGGYLLDDAVSELGMTAQQLLLLDAEGRCAIVELANNTVVFSLYCPANSMGTPEGQTFRLNFLEMAFQRCANLRELGKNVVVMGDINVSPDLIDSAETINELIKKKAVVNNLSGGGAAFEKRNEEACLSFQSSTPHRSIFHRYAVPSLAVAIRKPTQFLHDTTRAIKKRKLALYTVWNTMTNARQSNFGSRIDLILTSSEEDLEHVTRAEILPFLNGSDHCPVVTDFNVAHQAVLPYSEAKKLSFEAKTFYKLAKHRDVSTLFSAAKASTTSAKRGLDSDAADTASSSISDSQPSSKKPKTLSAPRLTYTGRKAASAKDPQQPIVNFFFQARPKQSSSETTYANGIEEIPNSIRPAGSIDVVSEFASIVYDNPPLCHHNERCILRTSRTQSSKGKKFWCCARDSKGSTIELGEHRCNFFCWTKKPAGTTN